MDSILAGSEVPGWGPAAFETYEIKPGLILPAGYDSCSLTIQAVLPTPQTSNRHYTLRIDHVQRQACTLLSDSKFRQYDTSDFEFDPASSVTIDS